MENSISDWCKPTAGIHVRQGWLLSPQPLNIFLEHIRTEAIDPLGGGIMVRFADNIDLIAETEEELKNLTSGRLNRRSLA